MIHIHTLEALVFTAEVEPCILLSPELLVVPRGQDFTLVLFLIISYVNQDDSGRNSLATFVEFRSTHRISEVISIITRQVTHFIIACRRKNMIDAPKHRTQKSPPVRFFHLNLTINSHGHTFSHFSPKHTSKDAKGTNSKELMTSLLRP